jgi:deazaflavin-dependent oxidoreductase (nitroreductase family)
MRIDASLAGHDYCYLTTIGRISGRPREIEIWFAAAPSAGTERMGPDAIAVVYMLSGGRDRSDWVRNLQREARVSVRVGDRTCPGRARIVSDPGEDELARRLLFEKYTPRYSGDLDRWRYEALPVAVDLE